MHVLVTGAAGFIGFHTAKRLLERGDTVVGFDSVNDYYDPSLKEARLALLRPYPGFQFVRANLKDQAGLQQTFAARPFDRVIHLAAQAGVRYSLQNPHAYLESNLAGTLNILEACRHAKTPHLTFASSSSVYGANTKMPFSVHDNVDHPVSLYAATKKANELMAHTYAHMYGLPCTGLRFFTVYGPWGRPDMALFLFTRAILAEEPIQVFNHGNMQRDFTYIDDIVEGVVKVSDQIAAPNRQWRGDAPDPSSSMAPFRLYNIGSHSPVPLMEFLDILEQTLGRKAKRVLEPMQVGDVPATFADVEALRRDFDFAPATPLRTGIERFVAWYRDFYGC